MTTPTQTAAELLREAAEMIEVSSAEHCEGLSHCCLCDWSWKYEDESLHDGICIISHLRAEAERVEKLQMIIDDIKRHVDGAKSGELRFISDRITMLENHT